MAASYYFSHDYGARSDTKIKKMLSKHGMQGYGIFWAIVESLYQNTNVLPTDYELLAYELRSGAEVIQSIIEDFGLFEIEGENFGSVSVEKRLEARREVSKQATDAVNERWRLYREAKNIENNTDVLLAYNDSNTIKERKGKEKNEIKEKNDFDFEKSFEEFRQAYPGVKRGLETEFKDLKKHKDWKQIIPLLQNALRQQYHAREKNRENGHFVPEWKHLKTYINQRGWEEEISINTNKNTNGNKNESFNLQRAFATIDENAKRRAAGPGGGGDSGAFVFD
jgi:hypothetical protein